MTKTNRDIQRKLHVLNDAEQIGDVSQDRSSVGIGWTNFYPFGQLSRFKPDNG
jgi:hypothetical protein